MLPRIRSRVLPLALILLVAIATRGVWISFVHPSPLDGRFDDTAWYRAAAHYFAHGQGYVNPYSDTPTAKWPPGYPVFLGLWFTWFGEGLGQTYGANVVLQVGTIVATYCIGVKLFDGRTALLAAAALAVWPGEIFFSSLTLSEPLFTFLVSLDVLLLLLVPDAGRQRGLLLFSFCVVAGFAALTRAEGLLLLPLALVTWMLAGHGWRAAMLWALLSAVGIAAVLAPWSVRNEQKFGSLVVISANGGGNLWIGNHDGATGSSDIHGQVGPQVSPLNLTEGEFEVRSDRLALRKALGYIATHPLEEVSLSVKKVRALYESDATGLDWNSSYHAGYYASASVEELLRSGANAFWFGALLLCALALVPLRDRCRRDMSIVLPAVIVLWTLSHIVFFGEPRFHYPMVWALALLGSSGALWVYRAIPWTESRVEAARTALRRPEPARSLPKMSESGYLLISRAVATLVVVATAAGITTALRLHDNRVSVSKVRLVSDGSAVSGASSVVTRDAAGIDFTFKTSGLPTGNIVTLRAEVFNDPANCKHGSGEFRCGVEDLSDPKVEGSVVFLGGRWMRQGDATEFVGRVIVGDETVAVTGDGLTNAEGADVEFVVMDHGPPVADLFAQMLITLGAGCKDPRAGWGTPGPNTCVDIQASQHKT